MSDKYYDVYNQEISFTSQQKSCIDYVGDKTLFVKGVAGAGKSVVLMAIANKLLKANQSVAIFTFQNTLVSTTKESLLLNNVPDEIVHVSTMNGHIKNIYDFLVKSGKIPHKKFPYNNKTGEEQRINNVKSAIKDHQTKYGKHRFHDIEPEFWLAEFDWMKQLNVWTNNLDYYLALPRKGRGGRVRMSAADRVTAYQLFTFYCNHLEKTGQADWDDQALFLLRNPSLIPTNMKYDHILIDEAQDLTTTQMLVAMHLYRTDMVVAMDANQKIHNRSWTAKSIGIESTTKKLTTSMRTTKEIDALADSVRSHNDALLAEDDKYVRAIPERSGVIPKIVHLDTPEAEKKYVINLIQKYISENPSITIGIIAATNKQIKIYSDWLTSADIPHEQVTKDTHFSMAKPGVKVVSAYGAKGLEFNCVIIPMFAEGYFPFNFHSDDEEEMEQFLIKMRNLVYVSMTRAKDVLTITYWGSHGSRFLGEMDKNLYELIGSPVTITPQKPIVKKAVSTPQETRESINNVAQKADIKPAQSSSLTSFLKDKGLEVIDKRDRGGALWVVGDKSIDSVLKETKKQFGALWLFSEKGGNATTHRSGWFTKCKK